MAVGTGRKLMKAIGRQGDFLTEDAKDGYEPDGYERDGYERDGYEPDGLQLFQRPMLHIITCLNRLHLRLRQALSLR